MMNQTSQRVALLFSGQGNPAIGMGSDIWDINPTTRAIWDCASDISGINLRNVCKKGPMNRLIQTTVQQLAVTALNVTLFSLYREQMESTSIIGACGHSVGEYSALYAAGAISLETLFRIIHFRANLMNDESRKHKGTMLAIKGISHTQLSDIINAADIEVDISCDNTPCQQVAGGTHEALGKLAQVLLAEKYDSVKLGVSGAWHTRLIAQGIEPMRNFLSTQQIDPPQYSVLMNVTGKPEMDPLFIKENLALQLTHPVKWAKSLDYFLKQTPPVTFVEISNKPYLGKMLNDFDDFNPLRIMHCRKLFTL